MSVAEIIREIDALPPVQQAEVIKHVHHLEQFERGVERSIQEADDGKLHDMEMILSKPPPSDL